MAAKLVFIWTFTSVISLTLLMFFLSYFTLIETGCSRLLHLAASYHDHVTFGNDVMRFLHILDKQKSSLTRNNSERTIFSAISAFVALRVDIIVVTSAASAECAGIPDFLIFICTLQLITIS